MKEESSILHCRQMTEYLHTVKERNRTEELWLLQTDGKIPGNKRGVILITPLFQFLMNLP